MFNMRIGDTRFEIYPLLDANEVMIQMHNTMKLLMYSSQYKTFITTVEKYRKTDDDAIKKYTRIYTYTLIVLKSPRHLKTNEIAILFKEAYKRHKSKWGNLYG